MAGRPTKYDEKRALAAVDECACMGATNSQIAAALGVGRNTIAEWRNQYPAFQDAITRARDRADGPVENALYERAKAGDTQAIKLWLNNRQPHEWRDKASVELTGRDGGPVEYADLTDKSDEQVVAEAEALARRVARRAQAAR